MNSVEIILESDEQARYYAALALTMGLGTPDCLKQAQQFEPVELTIEEAKCRS